MSFFGRSATRRAFRYIFARIIFLSLKNLSKSHSPPPFPNPNSHYLAKDAAAIPNAVGLLKIKFPFSTFNFQFHKAMPYAIYVSPFQGSLSIVSVIVHGS